jgi:8-amino-7-oxononanoate synthase
MKLLDFTRQFTRAAEVKAKGLYPYFNPISSEQDTEVICQGRKMLMMGSNNYLGLANHPYIKEKAQEAIKKYGTSCAGSRFLNGTLDIHLELEEKLAKFVGKEACLVYSTGFQTNLGVIPHITPRGSFILIDKVDHASIVDAVRLSFGKSKKYLHNDMESLEQQLKSCGEAGKIIIMDGIFSMDGDITDLPNIVKLAEKYGANILVDDAHAIGVLGPGPHFGLQDKVDIVIGTFSKTLASIGGFVAAEKHVIEYVQHVSRTLIFSAAISPPNTAAALAALEVMQKEPERIENLWKNTDWILKEFKNMGFNTGACTTPIIPLIVGADETCWAFWKILFEAGIWVNAVISPAVEPGNALIRISLMATHKREQLENALDKFEKFGKELGIIS